MSDRKDPTVYTIPVSPGRLVNMMGPWPLTQYEWRQLLTILELFRPGLTQPDVEVEIVEDS